nr:calcium-binding protein [uncultured Kingella sp.]
MGNIDISDYAALAEAAYADFSKSYENLKENVFSEKAVRFEIERTGKSSTEQFAKYVTDKYEVAAHWKDRGSLFKPSSNGQSSGFSATLFKKKNSSNDEYVLALRGTDGVGKDLFVTDAGDIVNDGLAHHQIVDMYNFWQQIKAEKGKPYDVMYIDTPIFPNLYPDLYGIYGIDDADGYFIDSGIIKQIRKGRSDQLYETGDERQLGLGIEIKTPITTVGHSLGGHLSAAFSRLFPDETEHSYMVNGAGFGAAGNPIGYIDSHSQKNIDWIFSTLNGASQFDKNKVTNLIGDKNIDVVANDWFFGLSQPGAMPELFIEKAGLSETMGHDAGQMSDTMMVASLFFALDSSLNNQNIAISLDTLNLIFQAAVNKDEQTLENIVYRLDKLLRGQNAEALPTNRNELHARIQTLLGEIKSNKHKVLFINNKDELIRIAERDSQSGLAARYALRELNPFLVLGADYATEHKNKNLELYSPDTPNGMTQEYIQKRAQMLAFKNAFNLANISYNDISYNEFSGVLDSSKLEKFISLDNIDGDWIYSDTASDLSFRINEKNSNNLLVHHVRFGADESDTLNGGEQGDYLFGGAGSDTLIGGLGGDYLEGGAGNDTLYAGTEPYDAEDKSTNTLFGGLDSDTLYGGAGDDFLFAGNTKKGEGDTSDNMLDGGAGNDYLYGDWGNDTLKGGAGRDNLYGNGGLDTYEGGEGGDNYYIRIGAGHGSVLNDTGVGDKIYVVDDEGNTTRLRAGKRDKDKLPDRTFLSEDGKYIFYVDENNTLTILLANDVKKAGNGDYKKGILKLMPEETASPSRPHAPKPSPNGSGSGSGGAGSGSGGTGSGSGGSPAGDGQGGGSGSEPEPTLTPKPRRATIPNYKNGDYGVNLKDDPKEPDPYPAQQGDSGRASNPDQRDGQRASSPIIIDLNGNGVQTYARDSQFVRFDLDNNGFAERTGWIDEYDGFLVRDINGDGRINNGSELFGNHTLLANGKKAANGFDALKELDSNGDGKITRADDAWSELRVWQDRNQDAWSAKGELYTLDELGITELNTEYTTSKLVDSSGNAHKQQSNAVMQDGSSVAVTDVWFATNLADTQQIHQQVVSDETSMLPEIHGFGNVPDLRQAMMNNDALKQAVKNYLTADKEQRQQMLDSLIYLWTGSDKIDAKSRGDYIDARRLVALEALTGEPFLQTGSLPNPLINASKILTDEYHKFARYVAANLDAFGNPIFKQVIDDETGIEIYDWSDLYTQLSLDITKNPDKLAEYTDWLRIAKGLITYSGAQQPNLDLNQTTLISQIEQLYLQSPKETFVALGKILANVPDWVELRLLLAQYIQEAQQTGVLDSYVAALGNNAITLLNATKGTDKDDVLQDLEWTSKKDVRLSAGAGNDTLIGGMGNDDLYGGAGNDTLIGGAGNDYLAGGDDADTYVFAKGHGSDKVYDSSKQSTVQFTDVNFADVKFRREGSNLVLFGYNDDDSVRLLDYMSSSSWNDSVFQFADKTVTTADLMKNGLVLQGNDTNESISGWSGRNEIYGAAGNDKIVTYGADDVLDGGAGDDKLDGGAGNDTLIGGAGNDYLAGGNGNDTYVFNQGFGQDTVYDYGSSDKNVLQFNGINAADISAQKSGSDLLLTAADGSSVKVQNYFYGTSYGAESFVFSDGTVNRADVDAYFAKAGNNLVQSMASFGVQNEATSASVSDNTVMNLPVLAAPAVS